MGKLMTYAESAAYFRTCPIEVIEDMFSDLYKEVRGFRPRGGWSREDMRAFAVRAYEDYATEEEMKSPDWWKKYRVA